MTPSKKLHNQWMLLMSGLKKCAEDSGDFNVNIINNSIINIDTNWKIETHFINNKYLEVNVFKNKEVYLQCRHVKEYNSTINIVLNFIKLNR